VPGPRLAVLAWLAVAVGVGTNELLARWVLARPQPAATPMELAVRQEIVGDHVRALIVSPLPVLVFVTIETGWALNSMWVAIAVYIAALSDAYRLRRVGDRLWHRAPGPLPFPPPPAEPC
jgi:hypothetical protein